MGSLSNASATRLSVLVLCISIILIILVSGAHSALSIPVVTRLRIAYIQVGAFKSTESAALLGSQLNAEGYPAHTLAGHDFHRVLIGPFPGKAEAQSALSGLLARGYEGWVREDLHADAGSAFHPFLAGRKDAKDGVDQRQEKPPPLAPRLPSDRCAQGCSQFPEPSESSFPNPDSVRRLASAPRTGAYATDAYSVSPPHLRPPNLPAPGQKTFETTTKTTANRSRLQLLKARYCNTCHSGKRAGMTVPILNRSGGRDLSPAAVTAALWNHGPAMWQTLGPKGLGDPPAFLHSRMQELYVQFLALRFFDPPGDSARGKRVFFSKGCARCHGLDGTPTGVDPPIQIRPALPDRAHWLGKMWEHADSGTSEMRQARMPWKRLTSQEMVDLMVYLDNSSEFRGQEPYLTLGDADAGQAVFRSRGCHGCHTVGEKDDRRLDLLGERGRRTKKRPLLVRILLFQWLAGPPKPPAGAAPANLSGLAAQMWNHHPNLQAAGGSPSSSFSHVEEMQHLLAYLLEKGYFFKIRGNGRRGQNVFRKKKCDRCHAQSVTLAGSAPEADGVSPMRMGSALWSHDPSVMAAMQKLGIRWPTLTGHNVEDLLESFKGKVLLTSAPGRRSPWDGLVVQVGAFKGSELASAFAQQLVERGYSPQVMSAKDFDRVIVGPFSNEAEASRIIDRLRIDGYAAFVKPRQRD